MKAKLIAIGNSKGIRIPKSLIAECGLAEEVELRVEKDRLVVQSPAAVRRGWDEAFAAMRARGHDRLLDIAAEGPASEWDETEWRW